jgi:hypothetical protein
MADDVLRMRTGEELANIPAVSREWVWSGSATASLCGRKTQMFGVI